MVGAIKGETTYINASICNGYYQSINPCAVFDFRHKFCDFDWRRLRLTTPKQSLGV